jgi:hypothetical protein
MCWWFASTGNAGKVYADSARIHTRAREALSRELDDTPQERLYVSEEQGQLTRETGVAGAAHLHRRKKRQV